MITLKYGLQVLTSYRYFDCFVNNIFDKLFDILT